MTWDDVDQSASKGGLGGQLWKDDWDDDVHDEFMEQLREQVRLTSSTSSSSTSVMDVSTSAVQVKAGGATSSVFMTSPVAKK